MPYYEAPDAPAVPQQPAVPQREYHDQSNGGGPSVSQGFTAAAAIATALTPLVSLARPRQARPVTVRRQPQRAAHSPAQLPSYTPLLVIGGALAVTVLLAVALKK